MAQASVGFPWFVVSVFVVGFLPGVLLLIVGRRGRRIDDHPVCRGCGFDLFGTREPIPDKHPRCPECGTRREPRVGNRERRGKLALAGVLLMLTSLGVVGVWGYNQFGAAQIVQYKPVWLLRWEAQSGTSTTAELALGEMLRRFQNGELSPLQSDDLMADAATHGPAGNAALVAARIGAQWDQLAAELMKAGHGSDAQREAVGRSWVETWVEVRPQVRTDQPLPIRIHRQTLGPPSGRAFYSDRKAAVVRFGENEYDLGVSGNGMMSNTRGSGKSSGWTGTSLRPGSDMPRDLQLGTHTFEISMHTAVTDGYRGPVLTEWTDTQQVTFDIVPADGDPITLIQNAALGAALEQAVTLRDQQIAARPYGSDAMLEFEGISADMAYQLYLQRGEQRWKLTTIAGAKKTGGHGWGIGGELPDELEDGAIVDLVFEPDADAARQTPGLTEILDHPFVIPDIKIVRPVTTP